MGRILFWILATAILAAGTHLAVVLFTPDVSMASLIDRIRTATAVNRMVVLERDEVGGLIHEPNPDLAYAVCPYDITGGELQVRLEIPDTYWSVAVYSDRGDNIYTLNDRQAGTSYLVLRLVRTGTAPEAGLAPALLTTSSVVVQTDSLRGIVMLRTLIPSAAYRQRAMEILQASNCTLTEAEAQLG